MAMDETWAAEALKIDTEPHKADTVQVATALTGMEIRAALVQRRVVETHTQLFRRQMAPPDSVMSGLVAMEALGVPIAMRQRLQT